MRRRILAAIMGITLLATVTLTLPLAITSSLQTRDDAAHELELIAERIAAELPAPQDLAADGVEMPDIESAVEAGVYLPDGTRTAGNGPARSDQVVASVDLLSRYGTVGDQLVLAQPIVVDERNAGVIRVAEPLSETQSVVRRHLLALIGLDLGALALAAAAGWVVAARLTRPLEAIRDDAVRLGKDDFSIVAQQSGVAELDSTSQALVETAARLDDTLRREREFAANASHQLRTPITAMRLTVEGELADFRADPADALNEVVTELDRLEVTIETLLTVAKDSVQRARIDVDDWAEGFIERWTGFVGGGGGGRGLRIDVESGLSLRASSEVLDEICDVMMSNALDYGSGEILLTVKGAASGISVTIADQGRLARDPAGLFVRNDPEAGGNGLGLALARALAEAEGGRLVLHSNDPTAFRVTLPASGPSDSG